MTTSVEDTLLRIATNWNHAVLFRSAMAIVGGTTAFMAITALVRGRRARFTAVLSLLFGLVAIAFAAVPDWVVTHFIQVEHLTRVRLIVGTISALILAITLEAIRRTALLEKYALVWAATALLLMLAAIFPDIVAMLRALTGMSYPSAIATVAFTFLVLLAFHFSLALSSLQSKLTKLSQQLAIMEANRRAEGRSVDTPDTRPEDKP